MVPSGKYLLVSSYHSLIAITFSFLQFSTLPSLYNFFPKRLESATGSLYNLGITPDSFCSIHSVIQCIYVLNPFFPSDINYEYYYTLLSEGEKY